MIINHHPKLDIKAQNAQHSKSVVIASVKRITICKAIGTKLNLALRNLLENFRLRVTAFISVRFGFVI